MIFSGDEMIFQTFLLKQIISTYSLIKKRMGGQWPGSWYSMARPIVLKDPANEPPPQGREIKKGITIAIRYTYNCCERVL